MKKFLILAILIICDQHLSAQYTDIINSKTPGNSESPYSVGTDVLQFETNLFYGETANNSANAKVDPRGVSLFMRYSKFDERIEVNSQIVYQSNQVFNDDLNAFNKINGISDFNVGVKYLIYQRDYIDQSNEIRSWKKRTQYDRNRWIPSIGFYIGLNTNLISEEYKEATMTPRMAILLQNNFSDRLNLITNFGSYKISGEAAYTYIITMTYAMSKRMSIFAENQGDLTGLENNNFQIGSGLAYLHSSNLQFDLAGRMYLNSVYSGFNIGAGVAWRLDMHQDELMEANQGGTKGGGNGFFSNLFKKNRK